jgi:ABC-type transport system involved in cytochrome bd biosynthesis fused ATPase/permease subunit
MQNYANHKRVHPLYHRVLLPVLFLTIVGAGVNLGLSWGDHQRIYSASLILVLSICVFLLAILARIFALAAQDRAIHAEENLRHYVLTGKLLDSRLTIRQMIALRFASDAEMPALAARAASENLAPDAIKRAVKDWRADEHRV